MSKLYRLQVFTPEHEIFDGEVESLTVTTLDGQFAFLANHEPVVMPLIVGTIKIKTPSGVREYFNSEGFLEADREGVAVFVQACESPEEIDWKRAEDAMLRAEERIRQRQSMREYQASKLALARAMERLRVKQRYN